MQVFQMDDDLAVQLSNELIQALGLKEGDELDIVAVREGVIEVARAQNLPDDETSTGGSNDPSGE